MAVGDFPSSVCILHVLSTSLGHCSVLGGSLSELGKEQGSIPQLAVRLWESFSASRALDTPLVFQEECEGRIPA